MGPKDLIYDEWLPYVEYEKAECDIKLKDGTIIYHCWPNAGKFNDLHSIAGKEYEEELVAEIMYRNYYSEDSCEVCKAYSIEYDKQKEAEVTFACL